MLWRAIREDLDSLESVSDVLLVLDVVIGFLSSAGGDPEQRVSFYLHDVLRYTHPLQSKTVSFKRVRDIQLHIISRVSTLVFLLFDCLILYLLAINTFLTLAMNRNSVIGDASPSEKPLVTCPMWTINENLAYLET